MTVNLQSNGIGVNSFGELILAKQGKLRIDKSVFVDPGAEFPESYKYMEEYIIPLCEELGIEFYNIPGERYIKKYDKSFNHEEYLIKYKMFPCIQQRSCTVEHKVNPMMDWITDNIKGDVRILIGIDAGEAHRAKNIKRKYPNPDILSFPLIDAGLNRTDCKRLIKQAGYPLPIKSGCFFCPYQQPRGFLNMLDEHPDLYARAENLERITSERRGEKMRLLPNGPSLATLRKKKDCSTTQQTLGGEEACIFCHQ